MYTLRIPLNAKYIRATITSRGIVTEYVVEPKSWESLRGQSYDYIVIDEYCNYVESEETMATTQQKEFIKDPTIDVVKLLDAESQEQEAKDLYQNLRDKYCTFKENVKYHENQVKSAQENLDKAQAKLDRFFKLAKEDKEKALDYKSYEDLAPPAGIHGTPTLGATILASSPGSGWYKVAMPTTY